MEILQAQNVLQTVIVSKQNELDAWKLALSILDSTFAPNLSAIAAAQADADAQRIKVAQVITERDTKIGQKNALIAEKDALIAEQAKTIADLSTKIAEPVIV